MARTLAACVLPALVVTFGWLRVESPRELGQALSLAALAVAPALLPRLWQRVAAALLAAEHGSWRRRPHLELGRRITRRHRRL